MSNARVALLAAVGGALAWLAGPPLHLWPCALFCLVPLALLCDRAPPRVALGRGALAGFFVNLGVFWWLVPTMRRFAELPWPLAVPAGVAFVAWQAAPCAIAGFVIARTGRPLLALPLALVGAEFVWPTVFPWHLGFLIARAPLTVQAADLVGYGVASLLCGLTSAAVASRLRPGADRAPLVTLGATWALVLAYGLGRMPEIDAVRAVAPRLRVGVVQPNFAPNQRSAPSGERREDRLARLREATRELERRGAEIVLWPESAYPFRLADDRTRDFSSGARERIGPLNVPLIFGARTGARGKPQSNSVHVLLPDGRFSGRYDKVHLVPFGETLPLYQPLRPLWDLIPNVGQMRAGGAATLLAAGGARLGPMICVEDLVPSHGRALARGGADLLVNLTNDVWFGKTAAADHHLASSVFRAIETRRDLVRATLTGISAHVDAAGRIRVASPLRDLDERAPPETWVIDAARLSLPTVAVGMGDALPWACAALAALMVIFAGRERKKEKNEEPGG
ncbi:MAG: apolipoprotein N-acyltransferase [Myxococcota bacterium]